MMATSRKTKTPQGWRAEEASNTVSDNINHTPIASKLKTLLGSIAAFDAALLALLIVILCGVLK